MTEEHGEYLAVSSEVSALGTYMCQLSLGERPLRTFDRDQAQAYCAEITWAIVCAEYDSAVFQQLSETKMNMREVWWVIRDLRENRRPILDAATYPLSVATILSQRDLVPRLTVKCEGTPGWQWEIGDARQHVAQVAEVSMGVDMDASYRALLRRVGLSDEMSTGYVTLLRDFVPGTIDISQPPTR